MDLDFPDEMKAFAEEVRIFVRAELPAETRRKVLNGQRIDKAEQVAWQRKLAEKGWAAPAWPPEHGGTGWNAMQRHVFDDVMTEEGAPGIVPFGQNLLAPVLIAIGTEAQKQRFLPRILTLEYWFCQGYSEPGAGSDLASLKTRAVKDGGDWVVNGQKAWTTGAHYSNMMFALVRTDPDAPKPQLGISMLIIPMDLPGITVRPVLTLSGEHSVNEVFFDDVRVPDEYLIGEPNKGWTYAKMLLGHERTTIGGVGNAKRQLKRLKSVAAEQKVAGRPLIEDPSFSRRLAEIEIDLRALEISALRLLAGGHGRNSPGTEANMQKIRGSEIQQAITELVLEAIGPAALPYGDAPIGSDAAHHAAPNYFMTRVLSIYGGSNEIQRNILSKSLGL